eukprot:TRINITY_DN6396_c0_g1_i1.p2 TRINITY_DN6396_c0_g1~~TRINITY_DN6396_c0_g1_i1.p2  ORF type:complete len:313 (+),score=113.36 TRINITY_DN6396_c0_g1_i1:65-1003(+)
MVFVDYIIATRPWSFTAAVIPVLVAAAAAEHHAGIPFWQLRDFWLLIALAVCVLAGANLTNTYYDHVNKIDVVCAKTGAMPGDPTLVPKQLNVTAAGVRALSYVMYAAACACAFVLLELSFFVAPEVAALFVAGVVLSYFYTAGPALKYKALGDVVIFLCFGPLLMQFAFLTLVGLGTFGVSSLVLFPYMIPLALLTECILHANNARDIEADRRAGATTLAGVLGFALSRLLFLGMIGAAYAFVVYIALYLHWGAIFALLTLPLAQGLVSSFGQGGASMQELPERVAQTHLPFGLCLFAGVWLTEMGLLAMV